MTDPYQAILKQYWGYDSFRGIQSDIIRSIGSGKDTLGLMPTGGGKSVTFQVPALAMKGICLVVTPLIALMKDQVQNLRNKGIKAAAIYSGLSHDEILVTLENCIFGDYKFLYVSPERLTSDLFVSKVKKMPVSFITVDEAHCISQWGYDFRPAYLKIADLRKILPQAPVLALTATATPEVVTDIQQKLAFREPCVYKMSFERKNLAYVVRKAEDKEAETFHILKSIPGSAIVYCRNRKGCKEMADILKKEGFTATFYHAGLANSEKDERQKLWQEGTCRVMVATNAFGMGIDKPDVRVVIHMDLPDSPEAYFQEAGRAGRDGKKAYAVLLYNKSDSMKLERRIPDTYPDKDFIRKIYEHVCYYFQMAMGDGYQVTRPFNLEEFCRNFKHFPVPTDSALKILTQAGYLEYTEEQENASRLIFTIRRDELYHLQGLEPEYEQVLQWVLRTYGGVFSDYIYIQEEQLAKLSGLTRLEVYQGLLALTRRRIINYIPYKKTPFITFTQKRIEAERIVIPPAVYEERKAEYTKRIRAMIDYVTEKDHCRSRYLLSYFGETNDHNCMMCDVCLQKKENGMRNGVFLEIAEKIKTILSEKGSLPLQELEIEGFTRQDTGETVHQLLLEEKLKMQDGILYRTENEEETH